MRFAILTAVQTLPRLHLSFTSLDQFAHAAFLPHRARWSSQKTRKLPYTTRGTPAREYCLTSSRIASHQFTYDQSVRQGKQDAWASAKESEWLRVIALLQRTQISDEFAAIAGDVFYLARPLPSLGAMQRSAWPMPPPSGAGPPSHPAGEVSHTLPGSSATGMMQKPHERQVSISRGTATRSHGDVQSIPYHSSSCRAMRREPRLRQN